MHHAQRTFSFVLVVDADEVSSYLTRHLLLTGQLTERVQIVTSAEEAIALLSPPCLSKTPSPAASPDLILLALQMPDMNGFELLEQLQLRGQSSLIKEKVVVLTSSPLLRDKTRAAALQVRHFLEKPLSLSSFDLLLVGH